MRGPNVFLGYYKEPEATAETLADGWLHSGDLGAFDADGYLTITGRKKEIIITAGGKNISPKNIEARSRSHALVAEAVVIGDRRKYLTALRLARPGGRRALRREHGATPARPGPRCSRRSSAPSTRSTRTSRGSRRSRGSIVLPRRSRSTRASSRRRSRSSGGSSTKHFAREIEAMYEGERE